MKKFITLMCCVMFLTGMCGIVNSILGAKGIEFLEETSIPLPDGLTAVEYLESTGTQYIDTGIFLNYYDVCEVKTMFFNRSSIFGTNLSDFHFNLTGTKDTTFAYYVVSSYFGQTVTSYGEEYVFRIGNGNFYIFNDLVAWRKISDSTATKTCLLFARNYNTGINDFLKGRIYWFNVIRSRNLICNMVPVRFVNELGEDEGAMYDFVSGELFRNQGSGSFVIGPDL